MPFDPNLPQENTPLDAAQMRGQFAGLKEVIDALPTGAGITGAVVESVTTLPPGNPAIATVALVAGELRFTFALPEGAAGPAGQQGNDGQPGPTGAQGPPGEVSQTDLNNGLLNTLSQTSNVTNSVAELQNSFSDPDAEALRQKMNELINALRR